MGLYLSWSRAWLKSLLKSTGKKTIFKKNNSAYLWIKRYSVDRPLNCFFCKLLLWCNWARVSNPPKRPSSDPDANRSQWALAPPHTRRNRNRTFHFWKSPVPNRTLNPVQYSVLSTNTHTCGLGHLRAHARATGNIVREIVPSLKNAKAQCP